MQVLAIVYPALLYSVDGGLEFENLVGASASIGF